MCLSHILKINAMETTISGSVLLVDYTRWLRFAMVSRRTIRRYDRQLIQIRKQHADLGELSDYLRACLHQRNQFFGQLALQLTDKVAQLRTEPANELLIRRMTHAYPVMQKVVSQLTDAFAEIEESYRTLSSFRHPAPVSSGLGRRGKQAV